MGVGGIVGAEGGIAAGKDGSIAVGWDAIALAEEDWDWGSMVAVVGAGIDDCCSTVAAGAWTAHVGDGGSFVVVGVAGSRSRRRIRRILRNLLPRRIVPEAEAGRGS